MGEPCPIGATGFANSDHSCRVLIEVVLCLVLLANFMAFSFSMYMKEGRRQAHSLTEALSIGFCPS